jgi:DNA repair protein RAD7
MAVDDEEGEKRSSKKRKLSKTAQAKLKAKERKKAGEKGSDDEDGDGDEDAYTALSKSLWTNGASKPPVGSFENCAVCEKQFTVVCHLCTCYRKTH